MSEKIFEGLLKIWAKAKARLRKSNKWESVEELSRLLDFVNDEDDAVYDRLNAEMKFLCIAPHIGNFICIYRFNGILVALYDCPGDSRVYFYSVVTYKDYVIARAIDVMEKIGRSLLWKFRWKRIQE